MRGHYDMQVAAAIKASLDSAAACILDMVDAEVRQPPQPQQHKSEVLRLLCNASSSFEAQSAVISLAYARELAVKERTVHYLLPQTCEAAVRRRELRMKNEERPAGPGVGAGSKNKGEEETPSFSAILPFASVFGLPRDHGGDGDTDIDDRRLAPSRESDRDHLTSLAACVSMQLYCDSKEVTRAVESVEWILTKGLVMATAIE